MARISDLIWSFDVILLTLHVCCVLQCIIVMTLQKLPQNILICWVHTLLTDC